MDASAVRQLEGPARHGYSALQGYDRGILRLLYHIFDFLPDADRLVASQVCQSWRSVAQGSMKIGRAVTLEHASVEAVSEFIDSVNFLSDHALDVRVHVLDSVLAPNLAVNVLLAIQLQSHRIRSLEIAFQAFPPEAIISGAVQCMLSAVAPHCHTLHLDAFHSALHVDISPDLFGGTGSLRRVTFANLALPEAGIPGAMRRVTAFKLASEQPIDVSVLLDGLPRLTSLSLNAPSLCGLEILPVRLETLKHVSLSVDSTADVDQFLRLLVGVPSVEVSAGQGATHTTLFAPLVRDDAGEVDIDLLIERNPGASSFRAVFTCADRGITRILRDIPLEIDDVEMVVASESIAHLDVAAHVRMIVLPLDMLECVGVWLGGAFPALQSVVIDMYPPEVPYSGRWSAPRLETLALAGGPARLDAVSPLEVDFLRSCVFGSPGARVYYAGGIRVDKGQLLCRLEDLASFTHCFPQAL